MGSCFSSFTKSTAEIAPFDCVAKPPPPPSTSSVSAVTSQQLPNAASATSTTTPMPTVRLYGPANSLVTSYVRFALLHKRVPLRFVPTEDQKPTIQFGSETVSGSLEILIRYIEEKFPEPRLMIWKFNLEGFDEATPLIVRVIWLQHRSILWHVARMSRWAEDLAARGGRKAVDPSVGTPKMEIRKFAKSYSELQEVMVEHAQMEERVLFPLLDQLDRGICKGANEEHGRELPMMNGIKEDIKSIGVLDSGTSHSSEALFTLASRLKSLQEMCEKHFEEEEKDLLPMVEAAEMSKDKHKLLMNLSMEIMRATHSHLFDFLLEGFTPQQAMQYIDLLIKFGGQH